MTSLWFGPSLSSLRCCRALLLILGTLTFSATAQTTDPAYLADMPSVDRVKTQIQGKDPTDTAARQVAVFTYLQEYIKRIRYNKDPRSNFTPDELRIYHDYWAAADQMMKDYNKTHTPDEAKAFDTLQFNYMLNNANTWIKGLIGPQTAAAYTSTLNEMGARQQAHVNAINRANEEAKAAAAPSSGPGGSKWNDPTAVAARRCTELGGTTGGCATKSFGQGLMAMIGGQEMTDVVDSADPVGVYLSGAYQNPSAGAGAALGFGPGSATIGNCGKLVLDPHAYNLRRTASGVQVTVANSPVNIVLAMRPDGSLVGPGTVQVNGRVITGYSSQTTTLVHQDGSEASGCNGAYGSCRTTTSTPIYGPATARCTLAALAAPAPQHLQQGAAADDGSMIGGLTGFMSSIVTSADPGIRMNGKFLSPTGLILDFEGDAVTLDCGQAHVKAPYTVQNAPNEFRISVNNQGGPFVLTLAPDNTLHGSGSTTVNGRLLVNLDANANPVFRPVSGTCSVNTFSSKSAAEYRALITNPPAPGR
jgi:hypothetical protein